MADKFSNEEKFSASRNPLDFIPKRLRNSLFLFDTSISELINLILVQNPKKSVSFDLISNRIIQKTQNTIAPFLLVLFNNCLRKGIFPNCFKVAQVTPLHKGGERLDRNSYRPISLLPALGKLLEKIILVRVLNFFDKHSLLSTHQFGFRPKFTTEYAILDVYEKLIYNLDNGLTSCTIFLDLAKAFDSVSHDILLKKLEKYGVRGNALALFTSYLDSRSQFIKLGEVNSSTLPIDFGVPQGSILGPLLFLIYINDLPLATNFFIKLYADDAVLCAQNEDLKALETEVNFELDKVWAWLFSNKLTLNIKKSKCMIISKKRKKQSIRVTIDGSELEQCSSYKYLGVIFDKNLNWKPHINHLCIKLARACGCLVKIRNCVSTETLREIYHALIHSYLRYGIIVWGNAKKTTIQPLITLINRAVRIMSFAPFGQIDLKAIFKEFRLLDMDQIFTLESANFMYKRNVGLLPTKVGEYFEKRALSTHSFSLRRRPTNTHSQIKYKTSIGENCIQIRGDKLWCDVPKTIQDSMSLSSFKKLFKEHLLSLT
ncbi:MAG TPA: hypothetical protein DDY16_03550 [Tenacibaculum sp.]|nr:hypothetical protein [Tenacibaculum sp.]